MNDHDRKRLLQAREKLGLRKAPSLALPIVTAAVLALYLAYEIAIVRPSLLDPQPTREPRANNAVRHRVRTPPQRKSASYLTHPSTLENSQPSLRLQKRILDDGSIVDARPPS